MVLSPVVVVGPAGRGKQVGGMRAQYCRES